MRNAALVALLFLLSPALSLANPRGMHSRMRPQLFRDRGPKMHQHGAASPHHSNVPVASGGH